METLARNGFIEAVSIEDLVVKKLVVIAKSYVEV